MRCFEYDGVVVSSGDVVGRLRLELDEERRELAAAYDELRRLEESSGSVNLQAAARRQAGRNASGGSQPRDWSARTVARSDDGRAALSAGARVQPILEPGSRRGWRRGVPVLSLIDI